MFSLLLMRRQSKELWEEIAGQVIASSNEVTLLLVTVETIIKWALVQDLE